MNPALAASLGLSAIFLALAHSCLHYFLAIEKPQQRLPLRTALLPWPKRGRGVSVLALVVAIALSLAATRVGPTPDPSDGAVLALVVLSGPLLAHVGWLTCCVKRTPAGWAFVPAQPTARASSIIFGLLALVVGVTYLVRRLT